ncbi:MAG TPA: dTDP-4-dehydrorhamnose 3,5-epimerase family protein [Pseudolabrys sp.]|nr:dTDP-4-dehydrorhamnose 3,5-epimerase family protein [Pseudolabrys sp.]
MTDQKLPRSPIEGVIVHTLTPHHDSRGHLVEIYRESWDLGCRPVQFNAVTSDGGVLRGVHVHVRHVDHLVVAAGTMTLGLHDIRPWSPTVGVSCHLELDASIPQAAVIPPGVAHGFYFPAPAVLIYGASHYWDPADEIACRWDCKELGIDWPTRNPTLSDRDTQAGDYSTFVKTFLSTWSDNHGAFPNRSAR